jgi:two-component system, NtrC family, sensor kinase
MSLRERNGFVEISVADNGIGISQELIGRIFSQGFSTRRDGHGFGLHSSVLAAEDMGGQLTAHSEGPGKGAIFVLSLPLTPPKPAAGKRVATIATEPQPH